MMQLRQAVGAAQTVAAQVVSEARAEVDRMTADPRVKPEDVDPVFEGLVRDQRAFIGALETARLAAMDFQRTFTRASTRVVEVADTLVTVASKDKVGAAEACKYKEACNKIGRLDGPCAVIAKLRADLAFNVLEPLTAHIAHHERLERQLENRRRLFAELQSAQTSAQEATESRSGNIVIENRMMLLKRCDEAFQRETSSILEWLLMLKAHHSDILDSLLQTVKLIHYQYYAASAHALHSTLPKTIEFRALPAMTPQALDPDVKLAAKRRQEREAEALSDERRANPSASATMRILETISEKQTQTTTTAMSADPIAVSMLTGQGFEEIRVRKALRLKNNDMQAALDWLIDGVNDDEENAEKLELLNSIRHPKSVDIHVDLQKYEQARRRDDGEAALSGPDKPETSGCPEFVPMPLPRQVSSLMAVQERLEKATASKEETDGRDANALLTLHQSLLDGDEESSGSSSASPTP